MNAFDVIGYIVDGEYRCPSCNYDADGQPIFADSDTDSFSHCATCEELIPEVLTETGVEYTISHMEQFLTRREGRPEILRQWAEHMKEAGSTAFAAEDTVVRLTLEATEEQSLTIAKRRETWLAAKLLEEATDLFRRGLDTAALLKIEMARKELE